MNDQIFPQPMTTIAVQELLKRSGLVYSGHLRFRARNSTSFTGRLPVTLERIRWSRVYAVICDGCFYIFGSDSSKKPQEGHSLHNFKLTMNAGEIHADEARFCFKLYNPHSNKLLLLSASSEREETEWRKKIDEVVGQLNRLPGASSSPATGPTTRPLPSHPPQASTPAIRPAIPSPRPASTLSAGGSSDEYDTIQEERVEPKRPPPVARKPTPLRPPPMPAVSVSGNLLAELEQKQQMKAHIPESPQSFQPRLRKGQELYERAKWAAPPNQFQPMLPNHGDYVIRKSNSSDNEVIEINTPSGRKKYKIFKKGSQRYIDPNQTWFTGIYELLEYYVEHPLMDGNCKLGRPVGNGYY